MDLLIAPHKGWTLLTLNRPAARNALTTALLAAVADALLQDPAHREQLNQTLLKPIRQALAERNTQRAADVATTKVEFFTVAREAGGQDTEETDE